MRFRQGSFSLEPWTNSRWKTLVQYTPWCWRPSSSKSQIPCKSQSRKIVFCSSFCGEAWRICRSLGSYNCAISFCPLHQSSSIALTRLFLALSMSGRFWAVSHFIRLFFETICCHTGSKDFSDSPQRCTVHSSGTFLWTCRMTSWANPSSLARDRCLLTRRNFGCCWVFWRTPIWHAQIAQRSSSEIWIILCR